MMGSHFGNQLNNPTLMADSTRDLKIKRDLPET